MGLDLFFSFPTLKCLLMILAVIAGIFVIATKNAIISVFNLIVLYILVAFYLIYIVITYLGISYIIVYIGAIAILFLFVIMMIDIEVVEKKNNNYLPLLFFLLGGFLFTLKNIFYNIGSVKINSLLYKDQDKLLIKDEKGILFNINPRSLLNSDKFIQNNYNYSDISLFDKLYIDNKLDFFFYNSNLIDNKLNLLYNNFNKSFALYNDNYHKEASFINLFKFLYNKIYFIVVNKIDKIKSPIFSLSSIGIHPFFDVLNNEKHYSEDIGNTLLYYVISNIIIGLLLLIINSSFSLSIKYLEKGGGFECGFTSFIQTRERYNIIFYRVSLLFLIFDLEIILAFPYPALYQKNQNISKNNILAFLYILVVGFIYELKEGALNIVKTPHHTDFKFE